MSARAVPGVLVALPVATLAAAYAWLAHDHRTPFLLPVVVHEGGRYTLAETILYGRHFLRELPIATLYAAASAGAVAAYGPRPFAAPSRVARGVALAAVVVLVAAAWVGAVRTAGAEVAWRELGQAYLRDDDTPVAGVHWGYHLVSTLAYVPVAIVLAAWLQRLVDGKVGTPRDAIRARMLGGLASAVVVLTVLCGVGGASFRDPRHLGHQAREAATHLVLTLPLSFAVLGVAGAWGSRPRARPSGDRGTPHDVALAAAGGGAMLAYLAVGALWTGAGAAAQPGAPLSSLLGAHCYEHVLDYALVILLVTACAPAARSAHE